MLIEPMMEKLIGHAASRHGGSAEGTTAGPGRDGVELPGTAGDAGRPAMELAREPGA